MSQSSLQPEFSHGSPVRRLEAAASTCARLSIHDAMRAVADRPGLSEKDMLIAIAREVLARDSHLLAHGLRTARYALRLGQTFGLSGRDLHDLAVAGLFHDIGKLTLPPTLTQQGGPLSYHDYALVQCHPRAGAELLMPFPSLHQAALWIAHHHERWDGTGYPYGWPGYLIPMGARILAVADTFDALGHEGVLKSEVESLGLLRMLSGSQLDPDLVACFAGCVSAGQRRLDFPAPHLDGQDSSVR